MAKVKMYSLCIVLGIFGAAESILTNPGGSKDVSKISQNIKKADGLEAQASSSHGVYGGFGEGGSFGGSGFGGGFGEGGIGGYHGYEDHHHKHHDHHHDHHHDYHHDSSLHKALAIKGLLVPLAGVALLGAAAAFVSNPVLLQLGVISGTYGRRRRDTTQAEEIDETAAKLEVQARLSQIQTLERFMAQVPKDQMFSQEKKLMANYLSCSGTSEDVCLERLACELHGPSAKNMPEEKRVMSIITNEIFSNELVPTKTKERMAQAVRHGKQGKDCSLFQCSELEALKRQITE